MIDVSHHRAARSSDRARRSTVGALLALAAVAWVATSRLMAGMDAGPGTDPGSLAFYSATWAVMMAAMMLPSLGPATIAYGKLRRAPSGLGAAGTSAAGASGAVDPSAAVFVLGYLALWALAGLVGYAVLEAGRALDGGLFAWVRAGRWTAVGVLALAAAYELTPRKRACLARCRGGRGLPPAVTRDGWAGALRMGFAHGGWCLGCCWALMAALFALGAMSLLWMVVVAAAIAVEKLLPWPRAGTVAVASLLAALAIGMAASPASVPGLTIPRGRMAMRAIGAAGVERGGQMPANGSHMPARTGR
jgi:predicted metal-binding membrane protein